MEEQKARQEVVSTGIELLETGLTARTWGNISCRLDEEHMLITPSGLDYRQTTSEDLACMDLNSGEWSGPRKPSSEKGIHASVYEIFPEVNFVIHTHQTYASAIGLDQLDELEITEEELQKLGGLAAADYGLPGTKRLKKNVRAQLETGAHTILMANHGTVIAGRDKDEAMARVILLEEICRRNCRGQKLSLRLSRREQMDLQVKETSLLTILHRRFPYAELVRTDAVRMQAEERKEIPAQLDDMAQMIGDHVPVAERGMEARQYLEKYGAVLVPGIGGIVAGRDADDTEALAMLLNKAAVAARHTQALGLDIKLSRLDCTLMHLIYQKKYAKKKNADLKYEDAGYDSHETSMKEESDHEG